jgi:hypothetical protein
MTEHKSKLSSTGVCVAVLAVFLATRTLMAILKPGRMNDLQVILSVVLAVLVMMLVQLAVVQSVVQLSLKPKQSALWALFSAVVFAGGLYLLTHGMRAYAHLPVVTGVHQLSLMLLAVFLGVTISYIIREPNILLPVTMVAALVDFWNVYVGPLGHIVATKPGIVNAVTVQMPVPVPGMPMPIIGMGDFVFLALYLSVVCRFGLNVRGTFWWGYALLTLTMLAVLRYDLPIPALVPMAIAVIGANARRIHLKRDELLATIFVGVIVLALLGASGIYMLRHNPIPRGPSSKSQVQSPKSKQPAAGTLNLKH